MKQLNYHHLLYFNTVMDEGSIAAAADVLDLTPQTISAQIRRLEKRVGSALFERHGRGLAPTETARLMRGYTEQMFATGQELAHALDSKSGHSITLRVGVIDVLAKLVIYRVLMPMLQTGNRLDVVEGPLDTLLAELSVHRLDMVLSDRPVPTGLGVRSANHVLGSSSVAFFGTSDMVERFEQSFPSSLQGAPLLLPRKSNAMRRSLDHWFDEYDIKPEILAEFDDSALMKTFGEQGAGLFPAPLILRQDLAENRNVFPVGIATGVNESLVAITPERRLRHDSVLSLIDNARTTIDRANSAVGRSQERRGGDEDPRSLVRAY